MVRVFLSLLLDITDGYQYVTEHYDYVINSLYAEYAHYLVHNQRRVFHTIIGHDMLKRTVVIRFSRYYIVDCSSYPATISLFCATTEQHYDVAA